MYIKLKIPYSVYVPARKYEANCNLSYFMPASRKVKPKRCLDLWRSRLVYPLITPLRSGALALLHEPRRCITGHQHIFRCHDRRAIRRQNRIMIRRYKIRSGVAVRAL